MDAQHDNNNTNKVEFILLTNSVPTITTTTTNLVGRPPWRQQQQEQRRREHALNTRTTSRVLRVSSIRTTTTTVLVVLVHWFMFFGFIPPSYAWASVSKPVAIPNTNGGITSLLTWNNEHEDDHYGRSVVVVVAGTKQGQVLLVDPVHPQDHGAVQPLEQPALFQKRRPLYSLACGRNLLCCGGGDGWITMYQPQSSQQQLLPQPEDDDDDSNHRQPLLSSSWNYVARLGPHTGWVKSIAMENDSSFSSKDDDDDNFDSCWRIHSIGCNIINTWSIHHPPATTIGTTTRPRSTETLPTTTARLVAQRSISSSPESGTTLSNDLLCLVTVPFDSMDGRNTTFTTTDNHHSRSPRSLLAAGGVDGRIHLWPSYQSSSSSSGLVRPNNKIKTKQDHTLPLDVIVAHQGRVTALVYCTDLQLLVSTGHDGCLRAFSIATTTSRDKNDHESARLELQPTAVLGISEETTTATPNCRGPPIPENPLPETRLTCAMLLPQDLEEEEKDADSSSTYKDKHKNNPKWIRRRRLAVGTSRGTVFVVEIGKPCCPQDDVTLTLLEELTISVVQTDPDADTNTSRGSGSHHIYCLACTTTIPEEQGTGSLNATPTTTLPRRHRLWIGHAQRLFYVDLV